MCLSNEIQTRPKRALVNGVTWLQADPPRLEPTRIMPAAAADDSPGKPPAGRAPAGGPTPDAWHGIGGAPRPGTLYRRRKHRRLTSALRKTGRVALIVLGCVAALALALLWVGVVAGAALLWMPM